MNLFLEICHLTLEYNIDYTYIKLTRTSSLKEFIIYSHLFQSFDKDEVDDEVELYIKHNKDTVKKFETLAEIHSIKIQWME
jgi:hypothetical protein